MLLKQPLMSSFLSFSNHRYLASLIVKYLPPIKTTNGRNTIDTININIYLIHFDNILFSFNIFI